MARGDIMIIAKYKNPIIFYSISIIIPWSFWFSAGYISHLTPYSDQYLKIASLLGFIGLLGPLGATCWLASRDSALRKDILGRIINFRSIKLKYLFLSGFLMLASILLAQAISLLFGYSPSQFSITGHFTFSSGIFPVWFLLIIAPVIEELAWHSYGTDCLRNRMNLFKTSLLFGAFWGVWHMPLSTIRDYYQSNLVATGWIYGVNFLVSIVPYVLLMNWLYYKSKRNIFIAIIFHISAGYFNEIFATHPDSKIIQTGLLLILATILILREKDFFFKRDLTGIDPA
jgi:membrane protease YdiL (CAAX protease family)